MLSCLMSVKQYLVDLAETFPPSGEAMVMRVTLGKHMTILQALLRMLSVY